MNWKQVTCHDCGGHGQLSAYTVDGGDFMGADECGTCDGSGVIHQTERGTLAKWPGGPLLGRAAMEKQP